MKNNTKIGSIGVGLAVGAMAYWFQPYNESTFLGINIYAIMGVGALLGACLLQLFLQKKPATIALDIALGVLTGVMIRIIFDITFWDSTSHNLFPFEVAIAGAIAFTGSLLGAFLGYFFKKVKNVGGS